MRFYVILVLVAAALAAGRVRLENVGRVDLRPGALTAQHRGAPVPQMACVGGSARSQAARVGPAACWPVGGSGTDTRWRCDAQVPAGTRLGAFDVVCEGWSGAGDPWVATGTCGLEYRLEVDAPPQTAPRGLTELEMAMSVFSTLSLVLVLVLCAAGGIVCLADCLAPPRRTTVRQHADGSRTTVHEEPARPPLRYTTRCRYDHPSELLCPSCDAWIFPDTPEYRRRYSRWSRPYDADLFSGFAGNVCHRPAWVSMPPRAREAAREYEPAGSGLGESRSRGPAPSAAEPLGGARSRAAPPAASSSGTGGSRSRGPRARSPSPAPASDDSIWSGWSDDSSGWGGSHTSSGTGGSRSR